MVKKPFLLSIVTIISLFSLGILDAGAKNIPEIVHNTPVEVVNKPKSCPNMSASSEYWAKKYLTWLSPVMTINTSEGGLITLANGDYTGE
ncbi:MAG: hypothetical protein A2136_07655 [Chloroflexi bacterium RBG_16_54_11]|nr:MAG: hypothetical protein A2136_07655 [Chloroflexi bacterium RBG_16_54_11]